MRFQTIFYVYWSHVKYFLNIKKHYTKLALPTVFTSFYLNSSTYIFRNLFESSDIIRNITNNFNTFFFYCFLLIIIIGYIIFSLIYSSVESAYILIKYIGSDKNTDKMLLKINELYTSNYINFIEAKRSDKVLLLYLYDLKISN